MMSAGRFSGRMVSPDRLRKGAEVIPGDPNLGFAANFLYTLTGKKPDDVMEHAFDVAYAESRFRPLEIAHRYGQSVHLLDDPLAWTLLARACSPEAVQPEVGRLVRTLYEMLSRVVISAISKPWESSVGKSFKL